MQTETDLLGHQRQFPTTDWGLVSPPTLQSLDVLIRRYWKPLYFYVRRRRFDVETSKDIVQSFLTNLIRRRTLEKADPHVGRFRTFILAALANFIRDWARAGSRLKRGGGRRVVPLDFSAVESEFTSLPVSDEDTADAVLNRAWARSLLADALLELRGSPTHLAAFRLYLDGTSYEVISQRTGLSVVGAKVAVHRLRAKLRRLLIDRIGETVDSTEDLKAEVSEFAALFS